MIKLKSLFRRGQGSGSPSSVASNSSKQVHQISPAHSVGLKSSASASSLDKAAGSASADLGATRKLAKGNKHSSKDKLNDLLRAGSKEKVFDDKKELKKREKQQQKQQQMQQVAQHAGGDQPQQQTRVEQFDAAAQAYNGMQDVSRRFGMVWNGLKRFITVCTGFKQFEQA
jgi:hypothetical protein